MLDFLKRRLKSEKGAMDSILVTLLLIIIAVGAVVGVKTWMSDKVTDVENAAGSSITAAVSDANAS